MRWCENLRDSLPSPVALPLPTGGVKEPVPETSDTDVSLFDDLQASDVMKLAKIESSKEEFRRMTQPAVGEQVPFPEPFLDDTLSSPSHLNSLGLIPVGWKPLCQEPAPQQSAKECKQQ